MRIESALSLRSGYSVTHEFSLDPLALVEHGDRKDNRIEGTSDADTLSGRGGDDVLYGLGKNDLLDGGGGTDILYGGSGNDTLDGGAGYDSSNYFRQAEGVHVDLRIQGKSQDIGPNRETLIDIESLWGTSYDDRFDGDDGSNYLHGGDNGQDTLNGWGGDDVLEISTVRTGPTIMDGGEGSDFATFWYYGAPSGEGPGVHVDLRIQGEYQSIDRYGDQLMLVSVENLAGDSDRDRLIGDAGDNALLGDFGDDKLWGGDGDDQLFGDGVLLYNPEPHVLAGEFNLTPINCDDRLDGQAGDDQLFGGEGSDTLFGGKGEDTLKGGSGSDTLSGGGGADTFLFGGGGEYSKTLDRIVDLHAEDTVDLSAVDADELADGDQAFVIVDTLGDRAGEALRSYDAVADRTTLTFYTDGDADSDGSLVIDGEITDFGNFVL